MREGRGEKKKKKKRKKNGKEKRRDVFFKLVVGQADAAKSVTRMLQDICMEAESGMNKININSRSTLI